MVSCYRGVFCVFVDTFRHSLCCGFLFKNETFSNIKMEMQKIVLKEAYNIGLCSLSD